MKIAIKKVVFLSMPMSGLPDERIKADIEAAKATYLAITKLNISQVVFLDNYTNTIDKKPVFVKEGQESVWYLGEALKLLSKCDEAFFWFGWKKARGCQVEHDVCIQYGIPLITIGKTSLHDEEEITL